MRSANLTMECVDSQVRGWSLTTWESKQVTDVNYIHILDWAMHPEWTANVQIGVAGRNLFTAAAAWELAKERAVTSEVEIKMLFGMATQQVAVVHEEVGSPLFYVPVVHPEEYDVAIAYLVRRLEENSADENFMASIFKIGTNPAAFEKERFHSLAAVEQMNAEGEPRAGPTRTQNRLSETPEDLAASLKESEGVWTFTNTPDSGPTLPANLSWVREIVQRIPSSTLSVDTITAAFIDDAAVLDSFVKASAKVGAAWGAKPAVERSEILHRAGVELARRRADLIEVAGSELGKSLEQADVEVSEACDFAHYYTQSALDPDTLNGAHFHPVFLMLVAPPWNFPPAIPAGGVLAAPAAGSAVILKPAPQVRRCGAFVAECLWAAGVPKEALALVDVGESELSKALLTHEAVERVVLTGGAETAELFRPWDPKVRIMAETSGKNAVVITPSVDLDLAVKDVVNSAFSHTGQKCSATSYVILVGDAGSSKRVHDQLFDAVCSLKIAWADDLSAQMGPLATEPTEKLLRGLTTLEPGQKWEIAPRRLDETNRLRSPGVRSDVEPGSECHLVEYFGPILGIIRVDTLEKAIEVQNATDYGLTASLRSLDSDEINPWLNGTQVGNVYVNHGITGAIVQRQPFGGWKRSVVNEGVKAGGPNYLFGFGDFTPAPAATPAPAQGSGTVRKPQLTELAAFERRLLNEEAVARFDQTIASDSLAAATEFNVLHDPSQAPAERDILRYVPPPVTIRAGTTVKLEDILHVLSAGLALGRVRAKDPLGFERLFSDGGHMPMSLHLPTARPIPTELDSFLDRYGVEHSIEDSASFVSNLQREGVGLDGRIRLIAEDGDALRTALKGSIDIAIWDGPITGAGRTEILPFVHGQAISITNHRFGNRTPLSAQVLVD